MCDTPYEPRELLSSSYTSSTRSLPLSRITLIALYISLRCFLLSGFYPHLPVLHICSVGGNTTAFRAQSVAEFQITRREQQQLWSSRQISRLKRLLKRRLCAFFSLTFSFYPTCQMAIRLFARKSWADTSTRKKTPGMLVNYGQRSISLHPLLKLEREPLIFHSIVPTIHRPATLDWGVCFVSVNWT